MAISLKHVTELLDYLNAILILLNANHQCAPHKVAILIPESDVTFHAWPVYHRFDMRIYQRRQHYIPDDRKCLSGKMQSNGTEQASPRFLLLHFDLKTVGVLILRPVKSKERSCHCCRLHPGPQAHPASSTQWDSENLEFLFTPAKIPEQVAGAAACLGTPSTHFQMDLSEQDIISTNQLSSTSSFL